MHSSKTKSGKHLIFHYEECPVARKGACIPADFRKESQDGKKPWFFMPSNEREYGTSLGDLRGYPMIFSPGFATPEEALQAAEEWEQKKSGIQKQNDQAQQTIDELFARED